MNECVVDAWDMVQLISRSGTELVCRDLEVLELSFIGPNMNWAPPEAHVKRYLNRYAQYHEDDQEDDQDGVQDGVQDYEFSDEEMQYQDDAPDPVVPDSGPYGMYYALLSRLDALPKLDRSSFCFLYSRSRY
ncbi:hypothetical protein BGZ54_002229 [Gamsiella multidivaricata]|nr:hypothetical protein BGZ54_002229 [Gamsiella multidivaricata]